MVAFALAVLAALGGAIWRRAWDRREIRALLARIERLETAWEERALQPDDDADTVPERAGAPAAGSPTNGTPSGDVLAGRTSHVKRLLGRSGAPLRSLGDQAILRVYERIGEGLTPVELAAELCVSLRTLERGLAQALECTPRQLILTVKMREARRLLQQGYRVAEVAQQLGFVNAFHFSRRFKALYHLAPSQVRPAAANVASPGR